MYKIIDYSDFDAGVKNYVVDTCEEVATLPGGMGSEAYCLEDSKTYIKDGQGIWVVKISDNAGAPGQDGVGIADIEKTKTEGLVDTYTITLTNNETETFTVTNGKDGEPGPKGDNTPIKGEDYFTEDDIEEFSKNFVQRKNHDTTSGRYAYIGESGIDKIMYIHETISSAPGHAHLPGRKKTGCIEARDAQDEYDVVNMRVLNHYLTQIAAALNIELTPHINPVSTLEEEV